MQLVDKKVLLIGASGGIGEAIAMQLDKCGAIILLVGRHQERLEALRKQLSPGHQILIADINNSNDRERIIEHCEQQGLNIYINAAGVLEFDLFEKQNQQNIEQIMVTNLLSPMLLCHGLLPVMHQSEQAAIVNIGSTFGSIGHPGFATYCASKFGLRGFTEALQRELADTGIKVFYLAPRATKTDLNSAVINTLNQALGNTADEPNLVAKALVNSLISSTAQHYMGWPEKLFVKLNGLFPGVVHNALVKKLPIIRKHADQSMSITTK